MTSLRLLSLVVVLAAASSSACLTMNPAAHVRPTGEPLGVDVGNHPRLRQGPQVVDEQDFYEIAGDSSAVQAIRTHRSAIALQEVGYELGGYSGIAGVVVGGGALAGGIVWTTTSGPIGLIALLPGALLLTASIVAIPVGFATAADVGDEMYEPVFPSNRAQAIARRYNSALKKNAR